MSEAKTKTIKEKMQELSELVAWFETDDFELEQASERYEAAQKLAGEIESDLRGLKNTIDVVKQKFDQ